MCTTHDKALKESDKVKYVGILLDSFQFSVGFDYDLICKACQSLLESIQQ